jgi:hypothetical protein
MQAIRHDRQCLDRHEHTKKCNAAIYLFYPQERLRHLATMVGCRAVGCKAQAELILDNLMDRKPNQQRALIQTLLIQVELIKTILDPEDLG